ncbi:MAG: outer membrane protein assembly factor BamE [Xanthomonadaceae bacterium]|nr:outer membrane protein assembly factor BamE [Xanthomonadaceae bacterium]
MRRLLPLALIALATAGCGILYKQPIYQGNLINQESVDQLKPGLTKVQVAELLGTPSVEDPFHAQRWDYTSSQRTDRRGTTQVKNFTLHFENGLLVSWAGDYFSNQDAELSRKSVRQFGRNLAREKNRRRR